MILHLLDECTVVERLIWLLEIIVVDEGGKPALEVPGGRGPVAGEHRIDSIHPPVVRFGTAVFCLMIPSN